VRLPACWCGLVALKPSLGRVPIDPPYVGRVAGPMTRIVDDAALMMSVLSRPDRRDGMSLPRTTSTGRRWKIAAQAADRPDARSRRRPGAGEGVARSP
jgi:Asp-tRNA(Asn)/Glu-tRNA(Gln) amidotransferase A subunit family amidase